MSAPDALLLDNDDLAPLEELLKSMGVDVLRCSRAETRRAAPLPTRLLITSGNVTFESPPRESNPASANSPIWICIHNQDFLPLRARLRTLGVQFLVQRALDRGSLRRFFSQLLYTGPERRSSRRLALGGAVRLRAGRAGFNATLIDLSVDSCSLLVDEPILPGTLARAVLPRSLGSGDELKLEGTVLRCDRNSGGHHAVVLTFENSSEHSRERLRERTAGQQIGTRVTPLATTDQEPAGRDRRGANRHAYDIPVRPVGDGHDWGGDLALGRDLSSSGVRVVGPNLEAGMALRIALYGGATDPPFVVDAIVVRNDGPGGCALQFEHMTPEQCERLDRLCKALPQIDSLEGDEPNNGRVVVSRIVERRAS